MLTIETTSNGKTLIRVKKDWNPSRIGIAYTHPRRTAHSKAEHKLQTALLRKSSI